MKLRKFVMSLTISALLPALAYAGPDPVAASFDRSFYNDAYMDSSRAKGDPVLASFIRDMERTTEDTVVTVSGEPDALTAEFYAALRDVIGEAVMQASIGHRTGG